MMPEKTFIIWSSPTNSLLTLCQKTTMPKKQKDCIPESLTIVLASTKGLGGVKELLHSFPYAHKLKKLTQPPLDLLDLELKIHTW